MKISIVVCLVIMLLAALMLAAACTPAAPAAKPPAAATPATTPATPSTPSTPAKPTPPADDSLPYKPATYTNSDLGFSIRYPQTWKEASPAWRLQVYVAKDPQNLPSLTVTVYPVETLDQAKDLLVNEFYKSANVTDAKFKPETDYALWDGTKCKLLDWTYNWPGGWKMETYALALQIKGKWVVIGISGLQGMMDYDGCKEVFKTVILK